jgi:diguanylate cyclase (GGDEF)-like protein
MFDELTGLPDRRLMEDRLARGLARCRRSGDRLAVMFVALDGAPGDPVLVELARRLAGGVRPGDTVARYGGEQFVVLCEGVAESDALDVAVRLAESLEDVGASIGLALANGADDPQKLLKTAERAMGKARRVRRPRGG